MGSWSSFDYAHVESLKKILCEILACHNCGSQSSFDYAHVDSLKKILGEILACHTRGDQSSFDHAHVESLKKFYVRSWPVILGESVIFWPCTCWIFKKILGEILTCHTGGVGHLLTMHMLNLKKNSRWDPGLSYLGGWSSFDHVHIDSLKTFYVRSWPIILRGWSSFDHAHVEYLKKILGEILACHTGGMSSFDHAHVDSKKNLCEILACHTGRLVIFWQCTCWLFKNISRWDPGLSYGGHQSFLALVPPVWHVHGQNMIDLPRYDRPGSHLEFF